MTKNLGTFDRLARVAIGLIFAFLWLYAPGQPIGKLFFFAAAAFSLWEAASGSCMLYHLLGMRKKGDALPEERLYLVGLLAVQLVLAYQWWHAGWEKITGTFLVELPKTLGFFASKNPYPFYKAFLTATALPNAPTFGYLVMYGQLLIGVSLLAAAALIAYGKPASRKTGYVLAELGLLGGALMNANFWLAAGWTGPAAAGSNVAMFWPALALMYVWKVRYLSKRD